MHLLEQDMVLVAAIVRAFVAVVVMIYYYQN